MMIRNLTRELHISWLVAAWCLGLTVGVIAIHHLSRSTVFDWRTLVLGLGLLAVAMVWRWWALMIVALIAGGLVGLWRGELGRAGLEVYDSLIGKTAVIQGRVLEDPDIDKKGQTVLRLSDLRINGEKLAGQLWVVTADKRPIKRSDIVQAQGKLTAGFGAFSASMYRAKIGSVERPVPGDVAVGVRDWFAERVRKHIPESESALGLGFLLGLRRAMPTELSDNLKIAGLTHIVVASGYNLTILVRLARRLFAKRSKYLAMLSAATMIIGFMAVTGLSPSMSRAGLVAGLSLAAWYYGRTIHPLVLLPVSAAITLMINPQFGWGDLGWQLSFASFTGVIILAPLLHKYFFGEKDPGTFRQIMVETLSAQLATLPLLMMSFGVVSNVALIANMLILPFVPLAMLLTFASGVLAVVPMIGAAIALPTTWLLGYMIQAANWLAGLEWAQMEVNITWWQCGLMYVAMIGAMWWMKKQTKLNLGKVNIVE